MTEARRLLEGMERIRDKAHEYRALPAEIERVANDELRKARAYLAQPMTSLTTEEQKWADATMDNTKKWLVPSLRAAAGRVAESRSREGELVAALRELDNLKSEWKLGDDVQMTCALEMEEFLTPVLVALALGKKA